MSHLPAAGLVAGLALLAHFPASPAGRPPGTPVPGATSLEPFELALKAELVVEGAVVDYDRPRAPLFPFPPERPSFHIEVSEVIAGFAGGAPTLEVEQHLDTTRARRYAPYERGQRAIFFLRRPRNASGEVRTDRPWLVLGTGTEGECPVVFAPPTGPQALLEGHGLELERVATGVFGHLYQGVRVPRDELVHAVRGLRRCFSWPSLPRNLGGPFPLSSLRRTCSRAELGSFLASSELARALVRDSSALAALAAPPGH